MKIHHSFLFLILITFLSWKPDAKPIRNTNSWNLQLNGKVILSSSKNKMGDEVKIKLRSLSSRDSLSAFQYLCGQSADNSISTLILMDSLNHVIKTSSRKNKSLSFEVSMPLGDVLDKLSAGQTLSIFFVINSPKELLNSNVLLGKIKLQ